MSLYARVRASLSNSPTLQEATILFASQAIDARDRALFDHCARVGELAARLTELLVSGRRWVELMRTAGALHDLGMIGVRDDIFYKRYPLMKDEWELTRRHPDIGADLLLLHPSLAPVAPLVRHHHERWDGLGYPGGLKGDFVPLGSRILAVAEAFDSITNQHYHRAARKTQSEAINDIADHSGSGYDPTVVAALQTLLE